MYVDAVLAEAGRFAGEVIAPLNRIGDRYGTPFKDGAVTTPPGWKEAYHAWRTGGWNGLAAPTEWGGQALPQVVNAACTEMWQAASMAFADGPMLTMAAIDALYAHGNEPLKRVFLEKLVSGEWMGTMQLTETAGRLRRRRAAHAGRARRRWLVSHQGTKNLHHLRRARPHRQHHPLRARAAARFSTGHARHFAVPGAQISCSMPTARPARATTCAPIRSSISSASTARRPVR